VRILRVEPGGTDETGAPAVRSFEAWVTSGMLRNREITVRVSARTNPTAFRTLALFWVHAGVALYNLIPVSDGLFEVGPDTFFILEPLRQANATTVARSMECPKPEIDRLRRGRGDTTVHTVRGLLVHAILDRLIAGEDDLEACYRDVRVPFLSQLVALADEAFDEDSFEREVLDHAARLREVVRANPQMLEDPQVEVRRYSPTIGIQGRIDAVFRSGEMLDIVELKTGRRLRPEDHRQLYVYRLLLSDFVRRCRRESNQTVVLRARLVSSFDGTSTPLRPGVGFHDVIAARNRLIALTYSLGGRRSGVRLPWADYDSRVCGQCPTWTRSRCRHDSAVFGDAPDAGESPELAYFRRFSTWIRDESWSQGQELASLLDDSRLDERVRDFRTIVGARCVGNEADLFVFEFASNLSELATGDRVLIHCGEIASRPSYQGYVRAISLSQVRIAIPLNNLDASTVGEGPWIIDRLRMDLTSEASQTGLYDFLSAPSAPLKQVILGDLSAARFGSEAGVPPDSGAASGLNPSQIEAVRRVRSSPLCHLIWGPPGTGKTRIIPEIVESTPGDVLLGAFTNTALDSMLMSLLDRDPEARFLRIGRSESSPELARHLGSRATECFSEDLAAVSASARELRERFDSVRVVAATAHRAASHAYLRQRRFELTVVDEASQLTEPLSLALVMRAARFVLIGDDRQLPPVIQTPGLDVSLFERLKVEAMEHCPEVVSLLDVQYRMHPTIMNVANRLYYGGQLKAGVSAAQREPQVGGPLVFVPVDQGSTGRSNSAEAESVAEITHRLLETVTADAIGIVSPFRAQVALLRQMLGTTGVTIDTVERFQGGERDIMLISFVRSRGSGFVFDDRRLNVAITRARRKLILIAHPDLFRDTRFAWVSEYAGVL